MLPRFSARRLAQVAQMHTIPLSEPYPGVRPNTVLSLHVPETEVSTLANGVRVASENVAGPWTSICVLVNTGARYESGKFHGASHFIDRLAFKHTQKRTHAELLQTLEKLGGNFACSSNRESILYQASVFSSDAEEAMRLLAETIITPAFTPGEVDDVRRHVSVEHAELPDKADVLLGELLHAGAFGPEALGNPHICTEEHARLMTPDTLHEFRARHVTGGRVVVAGAGLPHAQLAALAQDHFGPATLTPDTSPFVPSPAVYRGGEALMRMAASPSNNALKMPLTQVGLAFRSVAWGHPDLYATAVLQLVLGGGSSFSVGGPGKGMYSRMYRHVLNSYHWVESALATNVSYGDTGIFCLQGSTSPERITDLVGVLSSELIDVSHKISDEELRRARNQLKASLLMNLEMKGVTSEDIARQIASLGHRVPIDVLIASIDAVCAADIYRVATNMLQTAPVLAAFGNVNSLLPHDKYCSALSRAVQSRRF